VLNEKVFEEYGLKASLYCAKAHGGVLVAKDDCFYFRVYTQLYNKGD